MEKENEGNSLTYSDISAQASLRGVDFPFQKRIYTNKRAHDAQNYSPNHTRMKFFTPKQLAERWQCSLMKLRRMRKAGKLPVYYIGRTARYAKEDVERIESESKA